MFKNKNVKTLEIYHYEVRDHLIWNKYIYETFEIKNIIVAIKNSAFMNSRGWDKIEEIISEIVRI